LPKAATSRKDLLNSRLEVIRLCPELPKDYGGKHIAVLMLRSGTSPAPNYAEARSAESSNDFTRKLIIASKELTETKVWLKIINRSNMLTYEKIKSIFNECGELCRIIGSSIKTTVNRKNNR